MPTADIFGLSFFELVLMEYSWDTTNLFHSQMFQDPNLITYY
jgi:hypothetical protein